MTAGLNTPAASKPLPCGTRIGSPPCRRDHGPNGGRYAGSAARADRTSGSTQRARAAASGVAARREAFTVAAGALLRAALVVQHRAGGRAGHVVAGEVLRRHGQVVDPARFVVARPLRPQLDDQRAVLRL